MADKKGSSSYEAGDAGGACGDYNAEHGVSAAWVKNSVDNALMKGVTTKRLRKASGANQRKYKEFRDKFDKGNTVFPLSKEQKGTLKHMDKRGIVASAVQNELYHRGARKTR